MSASTSTKKLSPKEKIIFEAGREVGKQQEIRTRAKEIGLAVRMEKYLVTKDLITRILGWKEMEKESEMATVKTMVSQEVVRNILRSQLRQKLSQLEDKPTLNTENIDSEWELEKQRRANVVNV